jgi:hypothetical protein
VRIAGEAIRADAPDIKDRHREERRENVRILARLEDRLGDQFRCAIQSMNVVASTMTPMMLSPRAALRLAK